jgi:hypothetical protein
LELEHDCAVAAPLDVQGLLIQVDVRAFLHEGQLNGLELTALQGLRTDGWGNDHAVGEAIGHWRWFLLALLFLLLRNHVGGVLLEQRFGCEVGEQLVIGGQARDELDAAQVRQLVLGHVPATLLVVEDALALVLDHLDHASSRVNQMQLHLLRNDGAGGEHPPVEHLLVGFGLAQLLLDAGELEQLRLEDRPGEEEPAHGGLHHQPIVEDLAAEDEFALEESEEAETLDFGSVRVDDPELSLLEDAEEELILDEEEGDDDVAEGVVEADALHDLALVGVDANVLERGVVLPQRQNLGLVGGDCDGSSVGSDRDEHILVVQSIEPLSEGVLREHVAFVAILAAWEIVPVVIHNI